MIETTPKKSRRPETSPRKPGGGRKPKTETLFPRRLLVPLHEDDDDSLAAFARVDSEEQGVAVTKQDLVRLAISRYLIDRRII